MKWNPIRRRAESNVSYNSFYNLLLVTNSDDDNDDDDSVYWKNKKITLFNLTLNFRHTIESKLVIKSKIKTSIKPISKTSF